MDRLRTDHRRGEGVTDRRSHRDDTQIFGAEGTILPRFYRFETTDAASLSRMWDGSVRFRMVTGPEIDEARLVVRDGEIFSVGMDLELDGSILKVWQTILHLEDGVEFSFALMERTGTPVYLAPAGPSNAIERLDRWRLDLGSVHKVDTPEWAEGAVMYQVFPDRFANGDPTNDPADVQPWGAEPTSHGFQGGDLQGVIDHLDHLVHLGVDILYLNPVVTSPSNHRYDASDYHNVDPMVGGNDAMDALRAELTKRDMRLLVDLSLNHCHPTHETFADVVARGPESPYWDWFKVEEWPISVRFRPHEVPEGFVHFGDEEAGRFEAATGIPLVTVHDAGPWVDPTYDAWYGVATMPRFDLTNAATRDYLIDVARHWMLRFGADGIRMDVARYIELDVWRQARTELRKTTPDAYLVCEIIGASAPWLQGDSFDGTMNYVFRSILLGFLATDEIDGDAFLEAYERLVAMYTPEGLAASQNLLGSHDTPRFLTKSGGEKWRLDLATFLQLTLPGAPGIYYGDEVYLDGDHDPACRKAFPWGEELHSPLVTAIAELTELRRKHPALRSGRWGPLAATADTVSFRRVLNGDEVQVLVNRGDAPAMFETGDVRVLWGEASPAEGHTRVPPRSGVIVERI